MKNKTLVATLILSCNAHANAPKQDVNFYTYDISTSHPFGQLNPDAPEQIKDFAQLIGESQCLSESRQPDGTWNEAIKMLWRFKYIMNGMAVQDETLKADNIHSGSIRQYSAEHNKWFVHYYSQANPGINPLPTWEGSKQENGNIVLYRPQTSPNGLEGRYRITFANISKHGFNWTGEWVSMDESIVYPTWKISCAKS